MFASMFLVSVAISSVTTLQDAKFVEIRDLVNGQIDEAAILEISKHIASAKPEEKLVVAELLAARIEKEPNKTVKHRLVGVLADTGASAEKSLPMLIKEFNTAIENDSDVTLAFNIAKVFAAIGSNAFPATPSLLTAVRKSSNPAVRQNAAIALGKIEAADPVVINELTRVVRTETNSQVLIGSVNALGCLARVHVNIRPGIVTSLNTVLDRTADERVIQATLISLAGTGDDIRSALPSIMKQLHSKEKLSRQYAIIALSTLGPSGKIIIDRLAKIGLHDEDDNNRAMTVFAIATIAKSIPDSKEIELIFPAARDSSVYVRGIVALNCPTSGPSAQHGIEILQSLTKDKSKEVRLDAIRTLGMAKSNFDVVLVVLLEATTDPTNDSLLIAEGSSAIGSIADSINDKSFVNLIERVNKQLDILNKKSPNANVAKTIAQLTAVQNRLQPVAPVAAAPIGVQNWSSDLAKCIAGIFLVLLSFYMSVKGLVASKFRAGLCSAIAALGIALFCGILGGDMLFRFTPSQNFFLQATGGLAVFFLIFYAMPKDKQFTYGKPLKFKVKKHGSFTVENWLIGDDGEFYTLTVANLQIWDSYVQCEIAIQRKPVDESNRKGCETIKKEFRYGTYLELPRLKGYSLYLTTITKASADFELRKHILN